MDKFGLCLIIVAVIVIVANGVRIVMNDRLDSYKTGYRYGRDTIRFHGNADLIKGQLETFSLNDPYDRGVEAAVFEYEAELELINKEKQNG